MLLKSSLNLEYSKWFENEINDYINPKGDEDVFTGSYLARNGFFVTFGFDRYAVAKRKRSDDFASAPRGSIEFYNFNHFYNIVCRHLVGRHYAKPMHHAFLPLVIACADAQGTRYFRHLDEIENIHLHTIWVLRPEHGCKFESVLKAVQRSNEYSVFDFSEIDVRPIDRWNENEGAVPRLLSYQTKFLGMNTADMSVAEDFRIYPKPIQ